MAKIRIKYNLKMESKNKIIAGLVALGILGGTTVVALNENCAFDAEAPIIREQKVCFKTKQDFKKYKDARVDQYKNKSGEERGAYLLTDEGREMIDILDYEIKKKGTINVGKVGKDDDLILKIINTI